MYSLVNQFFWMIKDVFKYSNLMASYIFRKFTFFSFFFLLESQQINFFLKLRFHFLNYYQNFRGVIFFIQLFYETFYYYLIKFGTIVNINQPKVRRYHHYLILIQIFSNYFLLNLHYYN